MLCKRAAGRGSDIDIGVELSGSSLFGLKFGAQMRPRCLANHGKKLGKKEGHSVYWINAFGTLSVAGPNGENESVSDEDGQCGSVCRRRRWVVDTNDGGGR